MKVSQDKKIDKSFPEIHRVVCERNIEHLIIDTPGHIGWGGNSGFHVINLALQWGASKIILVGYDMRLDKGIHWHGAHPKGLHNPSNSNVARWRNVVDQAYNVLEALDVVAINCSSISALKNYPKMTLEEALNAANNFKTQYNCCEYGHTQEALPSCC